MYLITIEGGDGSGKGLATKVVSEVMRKEFPFVSVSVTGEPRRDHPLGRLAIDSVRRKTTTSENEAGLFKLLTESITRTVGFCQDWRLEWAW